jgi:hypothetical protein
LLASQISRTPTTNAEYNKAFAGRAGAKIADDQAVDALATAFLAAKVVDSNAADALVDAATTDGRAADALAIAL